MELARKPIKLFRVDMDRNCPFCNAWLSVYKKKAKKGCITERSWYFTCGCMITETFPTKTAELTVSVDPPCETAKWVIE